MSNGTAEATLSFHIENPRYSLSDHSIMVAERYRRLYPDIQQDQVRVAESLIGPTQIAPHWLTRVQDRISGSIVPREQESSNDGRWLLPSAAAAACVFFQAAADVLPGEPHISGSQDGELIAEFESKHGRLTSIITDTSVLLFAVIGQAAPLQLE